MSVDPDRLRSQLLCGAGRSKPSGVSEVAEQLLAIQAQDPGGARLAIRVRSHGLAASDVDRALDDRSVLISWLNRGTLHLVCSEDYPWLHALTAPTLETGSARRLAQEGVEPAAAERGVKVITGALEDGPASRERLREALDRAGIRTEGQALVHQLLLATIRGLIVRGPMLDGDQAFVLVEDWLGPSRVKPEDVDREQALAELVRRYLRGHQPAGERDLAKWAGLPLRDIRAGLGAIAGELDERPGGQLVLRGKLGPNRRRKLLGPKLLGAFDPLLLGWASREDLLGEAEPGVVTSNGIFRPIALIEGRAVATWTMPGGEPALKPFAPIEAADLGALNSEALAVKSFLTS